MGEIVDSKGATRSEGKEKVIERFGGRDQFEAAMLSGIKSHLKIDNEKTYREEKEQPQIEDNVPLRFSLRPTDPHQIPLTANRHRDASGLVLKVKVLRQKKRG